MLNFFKKIVEKASVVIDNAVKIVADIFECIKYVVSVVIDVLSSTKNVLNTYI